MTNFLNEHPGGSRPLLKRAGTDATEAFDRIGHSKYASNMLDGLCVGSVEVEKLDPWEEVSIPNVAIDIPTQTKLPFLNSSHILPVNASGRKAASGLSKLQMCLAVH